MLSTATPAALSFALITSSAQRWVQVRAAVVLLERFRRC